MSKRKLQWFVDEKMVDDWTDPRFPTIQGMMRRGLTMEALKRFILSQAREKERMNVFGFVFLVLFA
jgi:glutamyl-tRNA synthetase